MIQGIIFDCFGVLCRGSLEYFSELAPPESRKAVYDVSHSGDYGYITRREYLEAMAQLIDVSPEEVDAIGKARHVLSPAMIELVMSLRKSYKTALLSNVGHSVMDTIFTSQQLDDLFDVVILSADVGTVKPYPEIYELTASRLALQPEECIMIDDSVRNIEGAEMTGMKGILYGSAEQVKADIEKLIGSGNPRA